MANLSNRNTSKNTQTNTIKHLPFKAGDKVLCPSMGLGLDTFVLEPSKHKNLLSITCHDSVFLYDKDGFFVRADSEHTQDYAPSLFHDTPANRQAIATLHQCKSDVSVIDITQADDDEIIKIPSVLLSDTSCEVFNASQVLDDIASLLYIITNEHLSERQYKAMARFAYDTATHTSQAQYDLLKRLNEPLSQSKFGIVEVGK